MLTGFEQPTFGWLAPTSGLPTVPADADSRGGGTASPTCPALRILIVEDEPTVAALLEDLIREFGHQVVAAVRSSDDAMIAAFKHKPDLALMDIRLEGSLDGVAAAAWIRSCFDVPSVFISGDANQLAANRIWAAQPLVEPLVKPFTPRQLEDVLKRAAALLTAR